MFKRLICIMLILTFIIFTTMMYASAETAEPTVKLVKVEGLKNTLGVQKLDIRVNGLDGYKIIKDTDFESVYFEGEEILNVDDITKFKVNTCVLTNTWKWYVENTSLVAGENKIVLEIKKNNKIFKMIVVVVVDYPETSSTPEATTPADTTTIIDTSTPMPTTENITPSVSDTTTPKATTTPAVIDEDNLPHTGESSPIAIYIIGIMILGAGILLFRKFVLN